MKYFFTADTHFAHTKILQYCKRPFLTIEEHDEALIKNWNDRVGKDDTVFHLGDFGMGRAEHLLEIRNRLNGHVHLIRGNHDARLPRHFIDTFESAHYYSVVKVPDADRHMTQRIVLFHFPIQNWDGKSHGTWELNGHSHGTLPEDINMLRIDVGVDSFSFSPVPYETLRNIMLARAYEISRLGVQRAKSPNVTNDVTNKAELIELKERPTK